MTRIGKVTVKLGDRHYAPTVLQFVADGDDMGWTLAEFHFAGLILDWGQVLVPGGIAREGSIATHAEYRRAR